MKAIAAAVCLFILGSTALAQDQAKIDAAIRKGIEYLKTAGSPGHEHSKATHSDELILYTFVVADVPPSNPKFKALLERVLTDEPHQTYKVALQAMALEDIDRVKYQNRIAHCAQHLVDNQATNGQWSYGSPTPAPKDIPVGVASEPNRPARATGARDFGAAEKKEKPKVVRKLAVKRQRDGGAGGDNSNTQYAALGLRACYDAGILIPEETITLAVKWLNESAHAIEAGAAGANAVGTGPGETPGKPQGWAYKGAGEGEPYGSMTVGAVGALTIYDYMMKRDWKRNTIIKNGVAWITANYDIDSNPKKGGAWLYYYLYGLERVGMLYDTKFFGNRDWYQEGAKWLLEKQGASGAWNAEWDTCFAILFLKKATQPLVASTDKR
jgi:hypothetical protein